MLKQLRVFEAMCQVPIRVYSIVGGFNDLLFLRLLEEMFQFDAHILGMVGSTTN